MSHSAECDKREIINNLSAEYAQSERGAHSKSSHIKRLLHKTLCSSLNYLTCGSDAELHGAEAVSYTHLDGPTAIFVANTLKSQYLGAIMVAAYSYMALVPIVQPPVIRLLTTQKERRIRMPYEKGNVTQLTKILFPVVVTVVAGLVAPALSLIHI